jgi:hypothetical protein
MQGASSFIVTIVVPTVPTRSSATKPAIMVALLVVLSVCVGPVLAQSAAAPPARRMTNKDVIALYKAKRSDDAIVSAIRAARDRRFDLEPRALAKLRRAGVSANVIGELRRVIAEQSAEHALRASLAHARIALVVNETSGSGAYQQFRDLRADLISWKRFKVTDTPRLADVTVTFGPAYSATIRRRDTGTVLWTANGGTRAILMRRMKQEVPEHPPTVCVVFWCR